ncbi:malonyl-ACP O-methyltransferase BioC [Tolumonas lignilytica]|jgi:biotin biosynthesis protein BioC|uniref:malonyl-ACP O-methyltransferase BioC n=1 Tax=Tolumonas lignilytica TaxID=1283284 RepID=UPI000463C20F|nr:malonyl-ACP O-methyltransferase BioC [Tolumonas lignilytica]
MFEQVDKQALAERFGKAASSYDQYALLQKEVGRNLLSLIPDEKYGNGLDLGCGSGFFLSNLQQLCNYLLALDISTGMLKQAGLRGDAQGYVCGDAEALPLRSESQDLVFSSLALQWCHEPVQAFREIKRVLTSQGYALFATLNEGSLFELRDAWTAVDDYEHINQFMGVSELRSVLQEAGIRCKTWQVCRHVMHYADVNTILQSLKRIGASQVNGERHQGLLTRQKLLRLQQAYERYRLPTGLLPVTYNVCYGVLHR